jgi:hypothetical protein
MVSKYRYEVRKFSKITTDIYVIKIKAPKEGNNGAVLLLVINLELLVFKFYFIQATKV